MTHPAKLLALAFFLALVTLSLNYTLLPNLIDYDSKRVTELLIIGFTLLWVMLGGLNTKPPCFSWKAQTRQGAYLLLVLAGVSAYLAPSPRHAVLEVCLFAGLFYVGLLTAVLWRDRRLSMVQWMIRALLLGVVLYMVGFYTGYLATFLESLPLRGHEPFFGFSNVRAFNQYQLWTLSLVYLPLLGFNNENPRFRRCLPFILTGWWVLLFASASRGVLVAWLVAMPVTAGYYRRIAWPLLRLQLTHFVTGFSCYGLLFYVIPLLWKGEVLTSTALRSTTDDRIGLWQQAAWMIQTHPWLGVGPMHYAWYPNIAAAHPHNSLLQLAAEWGLPATFIILGLAGHGVFCWLKRFNSAALAVMPEMERQLAVVLFFTLVANACYSLVDGVIVMPMSQVMMAVIVGLMLGLHGNNTKNANRARKYSVHQVFAGVVLVAMTWAVLPDLWPRLLDNQHKIPTDYHSTDPRFWQAGGIVP